MNEVSEKEVNEKEERGGMLVAQWQKRQSKSKLPIVLPVGSPEVDADTHSSHFLILLATIRGPST